MEITFAHLVTMFVALFAIIDPFGSVSIFLSLTRNEKSAGKIAFRSSALAFIVLAVFLFLGREILDFFGVSIPAFQIGGGVIIFLSGLPMLFAYPVGMRLLAPEVEKLETEGDVSLVPLAVPMLAGPGAITTVVVLSDRYPFFLGKTAILGCSFLVLVFTFILFWQAPRLFKLIGQTGLNFLTRIMGLILIVLAVQYILSGIKNFFNI